MIDPSRNGDLDRSEVYHLLGNRRRLLVIGYLSLFDTGAIIEVRHIARVVRSIETGIPPRQIDTKKYESAYNSLIQTHLSKLEDGGLIEYDERSKEIVATQQLKKYAFIIYLTDILALFNRPLPEKTEE
ncbi:hypothetical protein BG842_02765 [Haladaptatus sp. W1]|nr:hypothetical protein BG842_02765 [Haladaptatus sp. W1]